MTLARFVESLLADGRVRVASAIDRQGALIEPSSNDLELTASILTEFESHYRDDHPGIPPDLSCESMLWGALTVFRASSFLAHRDSNADVIHRAMNTPCPEAASPSVCYSVDLTLRFLPDLIRLAKAASANDPLVEILTTLARQWPLSSVGVADVGPVDPTSFVEQRMSAKTLRGSYHCHEGPIQNE